MSTRHITLVRSKGKLVVTVTGAQGSTPITRIMPDGDLIQIEETTHNVRVKVS